jgi:hypothetical protein
MDPGLSSARGAPAAPASVGLLGSPSGQWLSNLLRFPYSEFGGRSIVSFKLKHVDVENELIEQDARDVQTKAAKTFTTWLFPVGEDSRWNSVP